MLSAAYGNVNTADATWLPSFFHAGQKQTSLGQLVRPNQELFFAELVPNFRNHKLFKYAQVAQEFPLAHSAHQLLCPLPVQKCLNEPEHHFVVIVVYD
jgi:hypothetical protein